MRIEGIADPDDESIECRLNAGNTKPELQIRRAIAPQIQAALQNCLSVVIIGGHCAWAIALRASRIMSIFSSVRGV